MKKVKVLIIGKSNVGKSSLINHLTQSHCSLVSKKIHSTRISSSHEFRIKDYLMQMIDTPGVSISENNLLSEAMKSHAYKHLTECDFIILLTQPQDSYLYEKNLLGDIRSIKKPYLVCLNKIDTDHEKNYKEKLVKELNLNKYCSISIKDDIGIRDFIDHLYIEIDNIVNFIPHKTNKKNQRYIIQELIRESLINKTSEEIPYESAVRIIKYKKQSNIDFINAEIIVSKESHKKIIIGKYGSMIKKIGIESREKLEFYLKKKIHLNLIVLIKDNWKNNSSLLKDFGYIE